MDKLKEVQVREAKAKDKPYKLFDGGGLFLLVQKTGGRLWRLKYRVGGREQLLSFGKYPDVPLKLARQRRDEARKQIAQGLNPSVVRKAQAAAKADTFKAVALEWMQLQQRKMAPATYKKAMWLLEELLFPFIGKMPIGDIDAPALHAALKRTEARGKHESAHRALWKAGQVFRYAIRTGRAKNDPTGGLRGALAPVLSKRRAAITDPAKVGALLRAIDGYSGQPATEYALKLAPLLFARPGELRGARWEEFRLSGKEPQWLIPADRMKMREAHIVPLSRQALALLTELHALTGPDGLLFPSFVSTSRPISENTLNSALRRLGYSKEEMTAHGFRAMASTCLNELGFPADDIELQLAHAERNKVRAVYARHERMPQRRALMQSWADYLDALRSSGTVVAFKRQA